jgi:glutathione S-transferase
MSHDVILHHYELSPYSEKVRKMLAHKQMDWMSVEIPAVMPKPDLLPLTGGYRKTPVLQIGRDVYCDTKLIARVLDQVQPEPPLVPAGQQATAQMIDRWVDRYLFFPIVALFFQPEGLAVLAQAGGPGLLDALVKDRMAMFGQGGNMTQPDLLAARTELPGVLHSIDAQLASAPYLSGEQPGLIDYTVYQPLWFIIGNPGVAPVLEPFARLRDWVGRIQAMGQGRPRTLAGAEAVAMCRAMPTARAPLPGPALDIPGVRPGDRVNIAATDYGVDPVQGELVICNVHELAVRREDDRAGIVVVHFPTEGFCVKPV